MRVAFQKTISHIIRPHETETANESTDSPIAIRINVINPIIQKNDKDNNSTTHLTNWSADIFILFNFFCLCVYFVIL